MTITDRDPAELLAGLHAPLPPGGGPDLDVVVAGGRRRRRHGRARVAVGSLCLIGVLGLAGVALTPALTGVRDTSPPPSAEIAGDPTGGKTSWAASAVEPGPIGALAQEQIDDVLAHAEAPAGGSLGPVRWSEAYLTAPAVSDGEALVAPSGSGGSLGYLVDQDPATDPDGHLDTSAAASNWSDASSVQWQFGSPVAGKDVREGDVVWASSGFADGSETSSGDGSLATSRDLVVGLLRDGVLYEVASTGSPSGGADQPSLEVLREAVDRIADAVSTAGLVAGADPGLTDGSAERDAAQDRRSAVAASAEQTVRTRIVEAVEAAGIAGGAAWVTPVSGGGSSTWGDAAGLTRSALTASGRAEWEGGNVEVAYVLSPEDWHEEGTRAADACDLGVLPDISIATCRALAPEGEEDAVALATSERVLADEGGQVVPIHRVAIAQGGQQLLLEVTGTQLALNDDELLALARAVQGDLATANEALAELPEP